MEIGKEFIENIQKLTREADQTFIGEDGHEYSFSTAKRVYSDPRPDTLFVKSLVAIVDYLENNVDKLDIEKLMIHVVDHQTVSIITDVHGERNDRNIVLTAQLDGLEQFPYDQYIGQEKFIIKCRSMFQDTDDLASILRYTAKIDAESKVITEDDGVTQNVNMKQGVSGVRTERDSVPALVKLKPFRTFAEALQPESDFLFRMQSGDGSAKCALFAADGGAWRNEARQNIAAFLRESVKQPVPILA
jgi:hypothetical protein